MASGFGPEGRPGMTAEFFRGQALEPGGRQCRSRTFDTKTRRQRSKSTRRLAGRFLAYAAEILKKSDALTGKKWNSPPVDEGSRAHAVARPQ